MKIWTLLFPSDTAKYASVRVAADTRFGAMTLVQSFGNQGRAEDDQIDILGDSVICQYGGEIEGDARVLLAIPRRPA